MSYRQLTKEEKKLNENSIKRLTEEIVLSEQAVIRLNAWADYLEKKRVYEDLARPTTRQNEDKELTMELQRAKSDIEVKTKTIKILQDQNKNGVEPKPKPTGV